MMLIGFIPLFRQQIEWAGRRKTETPFLIAIEMILRVYATMFPFIYW